MITGCTDSGGFPIQYSYYSEKNGSIDGFFMQVSKTGQLIFSSYFGGLSNDSISDLAFILNKPNSFLLTGHSSSRSISLVNPIQNTYDGGEFDLFICEFTWITPESTEEVNSFGIILAFSGLFIFVRNRSKLNK
ncbi:MAG: hypothetical protein EAX86_10815 [Candidatus Heimdallarchaeota archaeon]|nr:hypothetical protein [Candidatus Heimdallarchaeota archaeon]